MAPRKRKFPFPLVHVDWTDAQVSGTWLLEEEVRLELPVVHTVGFLIKEDDKAIIIASTVGSDRHSNAHILIPKGMIVDRREL